MPKGSFLFALMAAASMTASATGKVEMYGVVDLGISKGNGGAANNVGTNGTNDVWQIKQASALRFYGMHEQQTSVQSGFNVPYQEERFYAGLGYVKKNNAVGGAPTVDGELLNMAVHYKFDSLRLIGYVAQAKSLNYESKDDLLALDAPVGPACVKAAYYQVLINNKPDECETRVWATTTTSINKPVCTQT